MNKTPNPGRNIDMDKHQEAGMDLRDPARDHALRFVQAWVDRTGGDPHGPDAEAIFEQAYIDAIIGMEL